MRIPLALTGLLALAACVTPEDLRLRHGSPLYAHACENGRTFQSRQIISGEVEITAGGQTRDVVDAEGNPNREGAQLIHDGETASLTGMPGGPYTRCVLLQDQ